MHYPNRLRWTHAEEVFLYHLVHCFLKGILEDHAHDLPLRQYVAHELQCDPMRISKRLNESRSLLGRRISRNFNRVYYKPATDFTQTDIDALFELKCARNDFEVALKRKQAGRRGRKKAPARKFLSISEMTSTDEESGDDTSSTGSWTEVVM